MQLEENANYALQPLGGGEYFGVTEKNNSSERLVGSARIELAIFAMSRQRHDP